MSDSKKIATQVDRLLCWYGDGTDGSSPTAAQWRHLLSRPNDAPPTLINFFKLHEQARYPNGTEEAACSGEEAFQRYADVSVPTLEKVGGRFLLLAPFDADFIGDQEDWDVVAVGTYPTLDAVLALFEDPDYRQAYHHRTAACARQKVMVC